MKTIPRHEVHRYINDGWFVRAAFVREGGHLHKSTVHYEAWRPHPVTLSNKQQRLFFYIQEYIREHHYAPTYAEMMQAMEVKSRNTIAKWIDALTEAGYIAVAYQQHRGIQVVDTSGAATAVGF